jgi:hypothetical protein
VQAIPEFFGFFPSLAQQAISAQFDLVEDPDAHIRLKAIQAMPLMCKAAGADAFTPKIADVLGQLLVSDTKAERDASRSALDSVLAADAKATLFALFAHIAQDAGDSDAALRDAVFLYLFGADDAPAPAPAPAAAGAAAAGAAVTSPTAAAAPAAPAAGAAAAAGGAATAPGPKGALFAHLAAASDDLQSFVVEQVTRVLRSWPACPEPAFKRLFRAVSQLPRFKGGVRLGELVTLLEQSCGVSGGDVTVDAADDAALNRLLVCFTLAGPLARRARAVAGRAKAPAAAPAAAAAAAAAPASAAPDAAAGAGEPATAAAAAPVAAAPPAPPAATAAPSAAAMAYPFLDVVARSVFAGGRFATLKPVVALGFLKAFALQADLASPSQAAALLPVVYATLKTTATPPAAEAGAEVRWHTLARAPCVCACSVVSPCARVRRVRCMRAPCAIVSSPAGQGQLLLRRVLAVRVPPHRRQVQAPHWPCVWPGDQVQVRVHWAAAGHHGRARRQRR